MMHCSVQLRDLINFLFLFYNMFFQTKIIDHIVLQMFSFILENCICSGALIVLIYNRKLRKNYACTSQDFLKFWPTRIVMCFVLIEVNVEL